MKKRKVLQSSFSLEDKFESDLLEFALAQGDSSKYIKRLIYVDKEGFRNIAIPTYTPPQAEDKIQDAMKSISL